MTIKSAVKRFLDWTILLLWLVAACAIFLFTTNIQDLSVGPALMLFGAIGPIASCLVALRHRKRAAQFFFINGALAACCLILQEVLEWSNDEYPLHSLLTILEVVVAFFAVPGIYWLVTARRQWPPYLQHSFSRWTKVIFGVGGSLILLAGSAFAGLSLIPWGDCGPRLFASPRYPGHNAYTATIIYAHRSGSSAYGGWSIAKTNHKYWGIFGWNQRLTVLPYIAGQVGDEYLVEGHIRRSVVGYLLNIVEIHCTLTRPISVSALELYLLQTGPRGNGARIMGQVLKEDYGGKREPVPHIPVTLVLDHGPEVVMLTDAQGIFDYPKMPSGQYDIYLRSVPVPRTQKTRKCSGFLAVTEIAECTLVISDSSAPQ